MDLMPAGRRCEAVAASRIRLTPGRLFARVMIGAYRLTLSPFIGRSCRYLPTCSVYTGEAIERYGLWAGGWIGLARILRCHPWGASGYDPVPELSPRYRWWRPWSAGEWSGDHIDPATRLD
jgi:putative membrane protein insertion efficiency factor